MTANFAKGFDDALEFQQAFPVRKRTQHQRLCNAAPRQRKSSSTEKGARDRMSRLLWQITFAAVLARNKPPLPSSHLRPGKSPVEPNSTDERQNLPQSRGTHSRGAERNSVFVRRSLSADE